MSPEALGLPPRPSFLPPGFGTTGHQEFVEIVVPQPVPFTPQTAGWYLLGAVALAIFGVSVWRAWKRYKKNAYRRSALLELETLRCGQADRSVRVARLPILLKRCALATYERRLVAPLSGEAWLAFLNKTAPGVWNAAAASALTASIGGKFQLISKTDEAALYEATEAWVRKHRA